MYRLTLLFDSKPVISWYYEKRHYAYKVMKAYIEMDKYPNSEYKIEKI